MILRSILRLFLITTIFIVSYSTVFAEEELIIGRWCRNVGMNFVEEMKIAVGTSGQPVLISRYNDGSELRQNLVELSGMIYKITSSSFNDTLRIVEATGNLQLLDNDGLIGLAQRLGNVEKQGDCLNY